MGSWLWSCVWLLILSLLSRIEPGFPLFFSLGGWGAKMEGFSERKLLSSLFLNGGVFFGFRTPVYSDSF